VAQPEQTKAVVTQPQGADVNTHNPQTKPQLEQENVLTVREPQVKDVSPQTEVQSNTVVTQPQATDMAAHNPQNKDDCCAQCSTDCNNPGCCGDGFDDSGYFAFGSRPQTAIGSHFHIGGPHISGPRTGGPHIGGPCIGRPCIGRPHIGGPHIGGPHIGGPHIGGPCIGGPHIGGPCIGGLHCGRR